jgi:hypothetical protein
MPTPLPSWRFLTRPKPRGGRGLSPLGLIGIVLALAAQIVLPFAPMPAMSSEAPVAVASAASDPLSAWRCPPIERDGGRTDHRPGHVPAHDCPICQAVQQIATGVAPASIEPRPWPAVRERPSALAETDSTLRLSFSPLQPRAPPAVPRRRSFDT